MPITTHTCLAVTCDACPDQLLDDEFLPHYDTPDEAIAAARRLGWHVLRGSRILCGRQDLAHQAVFDELMPDEPQPDGQLVIDVEEAG